MAMDDFFKAFQDDIKRKCGGKLRLHFWGVDGWDRPIFADKDLPGMFFGDVDHLFSAGDIEELKSRVFKFYGERRGNLDKILKYFGEEFGCEPWGVSLDGINIELVED